MGQAPEHYRTIQIDQNLHSVPQHIVADIHQLVKPYDEFKATIVANLETATPEGKALTGKDKKALEAAVARVAELESQTAESNAEITKLTAKVVQLRAGGDSGDGPTDDN